MPQPRTLALFVILRQARRMPDAEIPNAEIPNAEIADAEIPDAEIIVRPNTLAQKIGPRARIFTAALVKRAEQALAKISEMFAVWLHDDIAAAERAVADFVEVGEGKAAHAVRCARQLCSSGSVFGYPIISRIGASLCALLEGASDEGPPPLRLATAHIDAIKAAARDALRTEDDPVANATCAELEAQTRLHLASLD
jgi:hypothetical protein